MYVVGDVAGVTGKSMAGVTDYVARLESIKITPEE